LQNKGIAPAVVAGIDREKWERYRFAYRPEQPTFFPNFANQLRRLGRPELAETPARVLINAAEPAHWHVHTIGLYHLSQVVHSGYAAGTESILRFLDRIATPAWLERQYEDARTGVIASSLFSLWERCEQAVLDRFCAKALFSRLASELKELDRLPPDDLSATLSLLGTSALIGVHADEAQVSWPQVQQVAEAIRVTTPSAEATTIGYIQIQFWLGLREMARLRPDHVIVPRVAGEQILLLWKNSNGYDKQQTLNAWMIEWLEQSARSNWMLNSQS